MGAIQEANPRSRWAKVVYIASAWIFTVCVTAQVFIAGLALFHDGTYWPMHRAFIHFFEFFPIIMLVMLFVGRAPRGRGIYWPSVVLLVLILVQYMTGKFGGGVSSAFHPVGAMLIYWVAVLAVQRGRAWPVDQIATPTHSQTPLKSQ